MYPAGWLVEFSECCWTHVQWLLHPWKGEKRGVNTWWGALTGADKCVSQGLSGSCGMRNNGNLITFIFHPMCFYFCIVSYHRHSPKICRRWFLEKIMTTNYLCKRKLLRCVGWLTTTDVGGTCCWIWSELCKKHSQLNILLRNAIRWQTPKVVR